MLSPYTIPHDTPYWAKVDRCNHEFDNKYTVNDRGERIYKYSVCSKCGVWANYSKPVERSE